MIDNYWNYEGELDEEGRACGKGVATHEYTKHIGMFFNDAAEGVGVREISSYSRQRGEHLLTRIEGEFKAWECFGLVTSTTGYTGQSYN